jgi:hypothetical protein
MYVLGETEIDDTFKSTIQYPVSSPIPKKIVAGECACGDNSPDITRQIRISIVTYKNVT